MKISISLPATFVFTRVCTIEQNMQQKTKTKSCSRTDVMKKDEMIGAIETIVAVTILVHILSLVHKN